MLLPASTGAQSTQDRIQRDYEMQQRQDLQRSFDSQSRAIDDARRDAADRDRMRAMEERRALRDRTNRNLDSGPGGGAIAPGQVRPN